MSEVFQVLSSGNLVLIGTYAECDEAIETLIRVAGPIKPYRLTLRARAIGEKQWRTVYSRVRSYGMPDSTAAVCRSAEAH